MMRMYRFIRAVVGLLLALVSGAFGLVGLKVNIGRVKAKMVTNRLVVRKGKKLFLLVGTSAAKNVKRKFFVRTEMFEGLRLSVGKIRKEVTAR